MRSLIALSACLGICLSAQAQFNAILYSLFPLTNACDGGTPLGPECSGVIYWDQNDNGPDAMDQPPVVGNAFGQCNFNTFALNGEEMFGVPGGFFCSDAFTIVTTTPQPSRYYIVVTCGDVIWTSVVFTIANGLNEYDLTEGWTCEAIPCDQPTYYFVDSSNLMPWGQYSECIQACAGVPIHICSGPFVPHVRPVFEFFHGCLYGFWLSCDIECEPAQFVFDPGYGVYDPVHMNWCTWFVPLTDGCLCLNMWIVPVQEASFAAVARNGEVLVTWATASEREVDHFQLKRDGQIIFSAPANNTSTGATYSYLDKDLVNGRTYTYSLETVDLNGTIEEWSHTVSATPSLGSAVITEYALHQNYPNPFNPSTQIMYDLVEENHVNITLFSVTGRTVAQLEDGLRASGRHTVAFDGAGLPSGLYFYTLTTSSGFVDTKKMLLLK